MPKRLAIAQAQQLGAIAADFAALLSTPGTRTRADANLAD